MAAKCAAPEPAQAASGVAALRQAVPAGFPVGFSGDWNVTEALIAGGAAWFSVAGGLFPRTCLAIVRAVAQMHAGKVFAQSEFERTEIGFALPASPHGTEAS